MAGAIWVVGETGPTAGLARISAEVATLARTLGAAGGGDVVGHRRRRRIRRPRPPELAAYVPARPARSTEPGGRRPRRRGRGRGRRVAAPARAARRRTSSSSARRRTAATWPGSLVGAHSAGASSSTRPASTWADGGPVVEMSVFGGKLLDDGRVHRRPRASSPSARTSSRAEPAATPGTVERDRGRRRAALPAGRGRRRVEPRPAPPRRSRRRGSSSPAAAASAARTASASSRSWRRRSAVPSGRRARRSTRAGSRTASRSARPARSSSRRSYLALGISRRDPAQGRDADRRARSSRSTATRTRRSPSSPTCSSSATCSRSCRRSSPRSAPERAERPAGARHVELLPSSPPDRRVRRPGVAVPARPATGRPVARADPRRRAVPAPGRGSRRRGSTTSLAGVVERIDARPPPARSTPTRIVDDLDRGASRRSRGTPRRRRAPSAPAAGSRGSATALVAELERAGRALEMVEHGCVDPGVRALGRPASSRRRPAIKRGYLNVLHAREAIARHAPRSDGRSGSATKRRGFQRRSA